MKTIKSIKSIFFVFIILMAILCFSFLYPRYHPTHESFVEGACSADYQTEFQSNINKNLQQPIINSDNTIVDYDTVYKDIKKIVNDGKYSDCEQSKDLKKMIDKNTEPKDGLPALKSYYSTKKPKE